MQNLDWENLGFDYIKTNGHVRAYYKDDSWGEVEVHEEDDLNLHIASTCLHYGQTVFEGMKAFRGQDNKIRVFRWQENAARMQKAAKRIHLPEVNDSSFEQAVTKLIKMNNDFVPPYDSGAALYIRPLLIGVTPLIKVHGATEAIFLMFACPVGPYFKGGFKAMDAVIERSYDRAAPLGTGQIKLGGNYAASLEPLGKAEVAGYNTAIFLDAKEKKYIDESGQANFFAIKGNKYITPKSTSILGSITNKSLKKLAHDMGMEVEERKIAVEELADFDEAGACGTAAVIAPIKKIVDPDNDKTYEFGNEPGPISTKLYNRLRAIQHGDEEDKFNWNVII